MKNKIILITAVLILVAVAGYLYSQKADELPEDSITASNKEEDNVIQEKEYISVTYPNGPTFEYSSDIPFKDYYNEYKFFLFGGSLKYAYISMMDNYSQSLAFKAGTGTASSKDGSVKYIGTKTYGDNTFTEYLDCGLDTCDAVFILKGPNDSAFIISGYIDVINPASVVFN